MVGLVYEMVGGRMIRQEINYGRNYFIRLSDYSLLFRLANRIFAYGYNIYRCMILETEIDGLLYSLDTDEQEAMVKKCVDRERTGEVVIPESFFHEGIVYRVTSIEEYAFAYCSSLTSITIPEGMTSIENGAFDECSSLATIIIPEGVTSIGKSAFFGCSSLISITIPKSVTSIRECAFGGCDRLTAIIVDEGNTVYDSREGCNAIIETSSNTLITGCSTTIISESVTSIEEKAFYNCRSLITINIPKSVMGIGDWAFFGCSSLATIIIPEGVTSIGKSAFFGCSSLISITIPKSVTSIRECAFAHCNSLTDIVVAEGNTMYDSREGCNAIIETNSNTLVVGCAKTVISEGVASMEE